MRILLVSDNVLLTSNCQNSTPVPEVLLRKRKAFESNLAPYHTEERKQTLLCIYVFLCYS